VIHILDGVKAAVVGVGGGGGRLAEHGAEVEEVLLGGATLGERAALPARDECWRAMNVGKSREDDISAIV